MKGWLLWANGGGQPPRNGKIGVAETTPEGLEGGMATIVWPGGGFNHPLWRI
jgi:hypothetical protein